LLRSRRSSRPGDRSRDWMGRNLLPIAYRCGHALSQPVYVTHIHVGPAMDRRPPKALPIPLLKRAKTAGFRRWQFRDQRF
jgi:hypothetical protein